MTLLSVCPVCKTPGHACGVARQATGPVVDIPTATTIRRSESMPETKRYDIGGKPRGNGRPYPKGTILKLTEDQAKAMGLGSSDVSKVTTTNDDVAKVDAYAEAMTSQERMREQEAAATADADAGNKARSTRK